VSDDLGSVLHARGLRLTPQRERVLDAVRSLGHATAEEVAAHLLAAEEPGAAAVNPSTVYRALSLLEELDLVARTQLDRPAPSFHAVEHADHLHLLCEGCGRVDEVPAALATGFAADVLHAAGFVLDTRHLALRGRCAACTTSSSARAAGDHQHPEAS
jgi:Fur family ferric uptake transcriptional regulator